MPCQAKPCINAVLCTVYVFMCCCVLWFNFPSYTFLDLWVRCCVNAHEMSVGSTAVDSRILFYFFCSHRRPSTALTMNLNLNFLLLVQSPVALAFGSRFCLDSTCTCDKFDMRVHRKRIFIHILFSDGLVSNLVFFFELFRCSKKWKWHRQIFQWIR